MEFCIILAINNNSCYWLDSMVCYIRTELYSPRNGSTYKL